MTLLSQSVQWHLTEVCPNRCKHCYIDESSNEIRRRNALRLDEMIYIIDNLKKFEETYNVSIGDFLLTGGDPFAYYEFENLLKELTARNKRIKILGIPERVTEENLKMLEKYNVEAYQVSLDGMPKTHNDIRGANSFERTIEAIELLNHSKKIIPHVMFTIHNKNYKELFPLIEYLEGLNLRISFSFDFLVFEGNASNTFQLLSKEDVNTIILKYREKGIKLRNQKSKLTLREKVKLFETLDVENANEKFSKYSYISGCACGISGITILPDGSVYPCRRLPITLGNLLYDDYTELFLNNTILRKLRRISCFEDCGDCDYAKLCRGCPALAYSITGNPFSAMPYCSHKKTVIPKIQEPKLDCTSDEEFEYITNNLEKHLMTEGSKENIEAVLHDLHKRLFVSVSN